MGATALALTDADGEQLEILIPEAARRPEILEIPHELIEPDPEQPRKNGDDELRASIAREGLLQDITVRNHPDKMGHYLIVDGERRWRSAAGVLSTLRCKLRQDLTASTTSRLAVQLIANTGKGLSPLEEAQTFQRMLSENPTWTVSDLAKHVGKPRSTVAQRLESMELGAWLEDVASGALSWTMLVETLLPYRGCPDKVHAEARECTRKDFRWTKGEAPACGPRDFENLVHAAYKPALYPLHKQKHDYGGGRQCEFNTKHHDAECSCGGMLVSDSPGETPRRYCGNPAWWGPQHRKALKDKPKTTATSSAGEPRARAVKQELRLPKGSTEVTGSVHEAPPDGCAWLTTVNGAAWSIIADEPGFDPMVLQKLVKPADLVLVRGGDAVRVATTNISAMKKARAAFAKRVQEAAAAALKPMRTAIKKHAPASGISGAGVQALLRGMLNMADRWEADRVLRALCVIEDISSPSIDDDDHEAWDAWAAALSAKDAKAFLTALAALGAAEYDIDDVPIVDEGSAFREAAGRKVPWLKEVAAKKPEKKTAACTDSPKAATKKETKKATTLPAEQAGTTCIYCGCTDDASCPGGCYWISTDPPVCSSKACRAQFAAKPDDAGDHADPLWDAGGDDELEDEE